VSSSYFEGKTCPLAARGYSRDERRGNLQIIYGLLCDRAGVPIAAEVFQGSTVDHQTVERQIAKVKDRFGLERVVLIFDRGMVTKANLNALGEAGIDWITALKAPQVKALRDDGL
jgi:transposase